MRHSAFLVALLLVLSGGSVLRSQAVDVEIRFRVDMNVQEELERFDPGFDFVVVRGTINGWGCSDSMIETDEAGVYELEIQIPGHARGQGEFKFNINCGEGDLGRWEDSIGNRSYFVNGSEQDTDGDGFAELELDTVFFDDARGGADAELRFSVDMNVGIGSGRFDPEQHMVVLRGGLNSWGCSEAFEDDDEDGIFELEVQVPGLQIGEGQYKFNIDCSDDGWEDDIRNRVFEFTGNEPDTDGDGFLEISVPTVFFNDTEPGPDVEFLFRVDMAVAESLGFFLPGVDDVFVSGTMNGWTCDAERPLTESDEGYYEIEWRTPGHPLGPGEYNFDIHCAGVFEPLVGRRAYLVTDDLPDDDGDGWVEIVPDVATFDDLVPNPDVEITFQVDMSVQIALGRFDPEKEFVTVRGDVNGWDCSEPLEPETDGSLVYVGRLEALGHATGLTEFKFNVGCTEVGWEDGIPNRTYVVTGQEPDEDDDGLRDVIVDVVFFDNLEAAPGVGPFVRGDCGQGGEVNISSGIFLLAFLFTGGTPPECPAACDADGDGALDITTAIYIFNWLFLGGPAPPTPNDCGRSDRPEDLKLGCEQALGCDG